MPLRRHGTEFSKPSRNVLLLGDFIESSTSTLRTLSGSRSSIWQPSRHSHGCTLATSSLFPGDEDCGPKLDTYNSGSSSTVSPRGGIRELISRYVQQCCVGLQLTFEAWLYSGMAFRIAVDLGIHLPPERLRDYVRNLTAEDIEIRKRLFWGCYTWDKAISLYLGRMPAFTPTVELNDPVFSK
jgi:hypothetical protein